VQAAVLSGIAVAAVGNWWSRWRNDRRVEMVTKPLVTVLIVVLALVVDADPSSARPWFVAGLVFCLVGDIALLPAIDRFVVGLAAFLGGHLLFIVGALVIGVKAIPAAVAAVAAFGLASTVGRTTLQSVRSKKPRLKGPVAAYLGAIMVMAILLIGTGRPWALAGAVAFVVSDSILAWNRFVRPLAWARLAIMVTYHVALVGLVLGLASPT
jgi:alkenylglycerophosphocholine hydrolase